MTGQIVAIKRIKIEEQNKKDIDSLMVIIIFYYYIILYYIIILLYYYTFIFIYEYMNMII